MHGQNFIAWSWNMSTCNYYQNHIRYNVLIKRFKHLKLDAAVWNLIICKMGFPRYIYIYIYIKRYIWSLLTLREIFYFPVNITTVQSDLAQVSINTLCHIWKTQPWNWFEALRSNDNNDLQIIKYIEFLCLSVKVVVEDVKTFWHNRLQQRETFLESIH